MSIRDNNLVVCCELESVPVVLFRPSLRGGRHFVENGGRAKSAGVTALFSAVCGWAKGRWRGWGNKQIPYSSVPKRVDGVNSVARKWSSGPLCILGGAGCADCFTENYGKVSGQLGGKSSAWAQALARFRIWSNTEFLCPVKSKICSSRILATNGNLI